MFFYFPLNLDKRTPKHRGVPLKGFGYFFHVLFPINILVNCHQHHENCLQHILLII